MKGKFIYMTIVLLVILSLSLSACTQTSSSTTQSTIQSTTATKSSSSTTSASSSQTNTTSTESWWQTKYGTPQYGGTLTFRQTFAGLIADPTDPRANAFGAQMETLFCDNMLTDRDEFSFQGGTFVPTQYRQGWLAESWEQTDSLTITIHLRDDVHWQNKYPTNGREFTADDVVYTWDRVLGIGNGYTEPNPFYAGSLSAIDDVVAVDKYTVQFKLKEASPMNIYAIIGPSFGPAAIEWCQLSDEEQQDWQNAVGTGAFILSDYVPGSSLTFNKNTEYWGYDERYPENKLPYLDQLKIIAIPDTETAISALRTGKIDTNVVARTDMTIPQAQNLMKTNPELNVYFVMNGLYGPTFKYGTKPFDNIKVRQAMQMSIDIPTIISSYKRGVGDVTPVAEVAASTSLPLDWAFPYSDWPQSLQQEYTYNPEKAKDLLSEAGYPDGFDTEVLCSSIDDVSLLEILKSYFAEIGVNMNIDVQDQNTALGLTHSLGYDQMVWADSPGGDPLLEITKYYSPSVEELGGVNDANYDAFVDKFNAASTEAECQSILKAASQYSLEQHWTILLGSSGMPQVYQPWVKGWEKENLASVFTWAYFERMWIDQSMKK